ncbi:MAG: cation diffusion facilitator family transporter [Bryobacteraceae bacterium]|jgi:cation diffusion facilitator family transporter
MAEALKVEHQVQRGLKSSLVSITSNFALAMCKCVAGVLGHSFVLVADGIESLADVLSSSAVYFGLRVAIKPPDKDHPYGHGKAEPVAAVVVSLALAAAGITIAIESIFRIRTPHPLPRPYTLWVLLGVVVVKVLLSRFVSSVANAIQSTAVRGDAWHHVSDAITSAFAFIGISVALWTKNYAADDWAALCASCVILFNAGRQLRLPLAELLDTAPSPDIEEQVRRVATAVPGVIGLDKCFVRKVGFRYYVELHVVTRGDITVRTGHGISHQVEDRVRADVDRVAKVLVHIEPEEELLKAPDNDV